jgi:hypothetical protein
VAGAKVTELVVNHRARKYGTSKYGIMRTFKVVLDLLVVKFLGTYGTKPIYFFGGLGFMLMAARSSERGLHALREVRPRRVGPQEPVPRRHRSSSRRSGHAEVFLGLLAEIGIRTYHESQARPIYVVRERMNATRRRRGKAAPSRSRLRKGARPADLIG